jgi:ankyrin repeat protein
MTTLLFKNVQKNNIEYVRNIIEQESYLISSRDTLGNTLLMKAVFWKSNDVARYLLSKDIDINSIDEDGWNALHLALFRSNNDIIIDLIDKGIDINCMDKELNTPLMLSINESNYTGFKILIEKGANTNIINAKGKTILQMNLPIKFLHLVKQAIMYPEPANLVETLELTDNLTFEDIEPGDKYAFRLNERNVPYFMGKVSSIYEIMDNQLKGSNDTHIFDMLANQLVPYSSIKFCQRGDLESIFKDIINNKFSFQEGLDINQTDSVLKRPLISWLIKFKQYDAFKTLLEMKPNLDIIDRDSMDLVDYILKSDKLELLSILPRRKIGPRITNSMLYEAIKHNNITLATLLLEPKFKLDVNWMPPESKCMLFLAIQNENEEIANLLIDKDGIYFDTNIMAYIAQYNTIEVAKKLCPKLNNSDYYNYVNTKGSFPLSIAASRDHYEIAQIFLENGADKNFKTPDGTIAFNFAKTPRMKLLLSSDPEKQLWINTCKDYMDRINKIPSSLTLVNGLYKCKTEKAIIMKELFDYLYDKDKYINSNINFKSVIIAKSLEFINDDKKDHPVIKDLIVSAKALLDKYSNTDNSEIFNLFDLHLNPKI